MNSMLGVLARVPLFKLYRRFGWPRMLPVNLTLSPSPRCNSRCLTCNIWMKREKELTLAEWERVLRSLGRAPYWFTISGGEPFLYAGIVELAQMVYKICRPGIINIPTNSILAVIPEKVRAISESCPDSQIVINLSLDGVGEKHDFIRGVAGNFEKFERTLAALLDLRDSLPNLTIGIHTVVSVFNIDSLDEIIAYAGRSRADQFISEIAEPRIELDTVGLPITPDPQAYARAVNKLVAYLDSRRHRGLARITEAFRREYYKFVQRVLDEQDQVLPCYAGWASAQIYADGTVWPCCVRADDLGNLREAGYDFGAIWFGERIKKVRRSIAAKECHCPLANAAYTTMLHDLPTLARVGLSVAAGSLPGAENLPQAENLPGAGKLPRADSPPPAEPLPEETVVKGGNMFAWLNAFHKGVEIPADYAAKTLAAYALGMKAGGALAGVRVEVHESSCSLARSLSPAVIYPPELAPQLPLSGCTEGEKCPCVYRPVMVYEEPRE